MSDLISRQDAVDAVNAYLGLSAVSRTIQNMTSIQEILENLPSAEPKTPSNGSITSINPENTHDRTMGDLISRQDAIEAVNFGITIAKAINKETGDVIELFGKENEALGKAIKRIKDLPSAEPEINKQKLIRTMNAGIIATNTEDVYSCGMRNGIRWCKALLEDDPPKFEDASQYAEPKKGEWINKEFYGIGEGSAECSTCHKRSSGYKEDDGWGVHCLFYDFCPICGSCNRERGE